MAALIVRVSFAEMVSFISVLDKRYPESGVPVPSQKTHASR